MGWVLAHSWTAKPTADGGRLIVLKAGVNSQAVYSRFNKGCPTKVYKRTRQC